jgi:hypothetical protein
LPILVILVARFAIQRLLAREGDALEIDEDHHFGLRTSLGRPFPDDQFKTNSGRETMGAIVVADKNRAGIGASKRLRRAPAKFACV